jgi:hypothetical protein
MRREILLGALLLSGGLYAQNWPTVEQEAKPGARWWWLGSAVDKESLSYNLQEYAKAGLGGLEITPIYGVQGNDDKNIPFLSAKWMEMLRHTEAEGKRVGIEVDMNTGTGWPFGGPSVSSDDAATKAIFHCDTISGGKSITLDVSVKDQKQAKVARLSRVMAYNGNGKCLNLTSMVKDDQLTWDAPAGEWTVITLHVGKTLQMVKRAAPGGEGYVMDHLDKNAVSRYLAGFDKAFKDNATSHPHTFFNDSYEVYGADWTPTLLDEFYKRRGYRLEEHFPEFLAEVRDDKASRIVADYRETISDLLIENFTAQWTNWAHKNGSITRNQAHGSPANLIDTYAAVDIPECEGFGLSQFHIKGLRQDSLTRKNDSDMSMLKYASSAAHISGKRFTSSETFTWLTEHFRTSLSQCKPDMDLMFVSGVNHMFFHGTPYSPKEAKWPGWKFYASIDMSPTNSIWRDAPEFFNYITRCQSFLQMGKPDNDFLVYLPVYDMWQEQPGRLLMFSIHEMAKRAPKFIETVNTINSCGYDMDYISDKFVKSTKVSGGKLLTEGGTAYKAIIVPAVKLMPAEVLEHLLKLASQGATVIFTEQYPTDVPGFGKLESRRAAFQKQAKRLPDAKEFGETVVTKLGKGLIITGSDYRSALSKSGVEAEEMRTAHGLQCIRRSNDTGHHYFISSLQSKGFDGWTTLAVDAEEVMLFNPMTGEKGVAQTRTNGGKREVRLQLRSGESVILQTFGSKLSGESAWRYTEEQPLSISIDHGWRLKFAESTPEVKGEFDIDEPKSWTEIDADNTKTTMATGIYSTSFTLPDIKADDWIIDLGDVRESARVRVNGEYAGTAWAVPFRLSIGRLLKSGVNTIEVEVTNLPANRIAEMDRRGEKWRIFNEINVVNLKYQRDPYSNWEPMPSGLNGAVKLIPVNYK